MRDRESSPTRAGEVLPRNRAMLALAERMGFTQQLLASDEDVVRISRRL
ncbi:MAG: hypothetical protein AB1344_06170 [Pseudomonadota bacterium]